MPVTRPTSSLAGSPGSAGVGPLAAKGAGNTPPPPSSDTLCTQEPRIAAPTITVAAAYENSQPPTDGRKENSEAASAGPESTMMEGISGARTAVAE